MLIFYLLNKDENTNTYTFIVILFSLYSYYPWYSLKKKEFPRPVTESELLVSPYHREGPDGRKKTERRTPNLEYYEKEKIRWNNSILTVRFSMCINYTCWTAQTSIYISF